MSDEVAFSGWPAVEVGGEDAIPIAAIEVAVEGGRGIAVSVDVAVSEVRGCCDGLSGLPWDVGDHSGKRGLCGILRRRRSLAGRDVADESQTGPEVWVVADQGVNVGLELLDVIGAVLWELRRGSCCGWRDPEVAVPGNVLELFVELVFKARGDPNAAWNAREAPEDGSVPPQYPLFHVAVAPGMGVA